MILNCNECNNSCLEDFMYKIKCNYSWHPNAIKSICHDCYLKTSTIIDYDWKSALINNYNVNAKNLDHSDITYYKKCSLYSIVKINDITKFICDNCMENIIEYNTYIPWKLYKCSMCNLEFNHNKIDEIQCHGKCEQVLDVCKDCHKNIMVDYQHFGLGIYEVCMECIDDYHKFMNNNQPPLPPWSDDES